MELKDTVEKMNSSDYKERFQAEYDQVVIRFCKLDNMLFRWARGKLDFEPSCPIEVLQAQRDAMSAYRRILECRAKIENIELMEG